MLLQRVVVVVVVAGLVTVVELYGSPPQPLPQHSRSASLSPQLPYLDSHRDYSGVVPAGDVLQVTHTDPCPRHNQRGLFHKFTYKTSTEAVTVRETVTKLFTCTAAYPDHLKYCRRTHRTLLLQPTPLIRTLAPLHSVTEDLLVTLLNPFPGTLLDTHPVTHPGTHTTHPATPKHDRVLPHSPELMPGGTLDTLLVESITGQQHVGEVRPECEPIHEALTEALSKPQSEEQGFDTHMDRHLKTLLQPNAVSRVPQYTRVPSLYHTVERRTNPRFLAKVEYIKLVTSTTTSTSTYTDYHQTVSLIYRGCIPDDAPKVPKCPPPDTKHYTTSHGTHQHAHSHIPCMGACFGQCQGRCDGLCIGQCIDSPTGRAEMSVTNCTEGAESCLSVAEKERVAGDTEDETKKDRKARDTEDDTEDRKARDTMDETKKDREGRNTQEDETIMGRSGMECPGDCYGFCDGSCNGQCDGFCSTV